MAPSELDSFYFKFKNLLFAEKNATLTIKSEAGRAQATLSVDLGHVLPEPGPHQPHAVRNSNSRSRRRERRAEARQLVASEADTVDKSTATDIAEVAVSVENTFQDEEGNTTVNVAPAEVEEANENCDKNAEKAEQNSLNKIDATEKLTESLQGNETVSTPFKVVDEVCNDETYDNRQEKPEEDSIEKSNELVDATF